MSTVTLRSARSVATTPQPAATAGADTHLGLTVRTPRAFDPPYDDDGFGSGDGTLSAAAVTQGALALAFPLTSAPSTPTLRLLAAVPPGQYGGDDLDDGGEDCLLFGPQRTRRSALPAPRPWSARLVQALTEVLAGDRPAGQLVPYLSAEVYAAVERRTSRMPRPAGRRLPPGPAVRSVHVCEPADGVAEVAAVVRRGSRMTAIALRMEGIDGRWRCTVLQVG